MRPRHRFRQFLKGTLLLWLAAVPASAGEAPENQSQVREPSVDSQDLALTYRIFTAGLPVLLANIDVSMKAQCFGIRLRAKPEGVPAALSDFSLKSEAAGCINGSGLEPESYASRYETKKKTRSVVISYDSGGTAQARTTPPPHQDNRKAIAEDELGEALDPLSTAYAVVQGIRRNGSCAGKVSVYDGRRLFGLKLVDLGDTWVDGEDYGGYIGPAMKCRAALEMRAGFKKSEIRKRRYPDEITFYFAEALEQAPLLPVQFESGNMVGALRVVKPATATAE